MNMSLQKAINILKQSVADPRLGIPKQLFYYVSSITPLVNVDLLLKDSFGRTLLAWRSDRYDGKGWHIPGGIVRVKETFEERIAKVAKEEIGIINITYDKEPLLIQQMINREKSIRCHFISFLFRCYIAETFEPENRNLSENETGFLKWHDKCPSDLILAQSVYRKYINER